MRDVKYPRPWRLVRVPHEPEDGTDEEMDLYWRMRERHVLRYGLTSDIVEAADGSVVLYVDPSDGEYTAAITEDALRDALGVIL